MKAWKNEIVQEMGKLTTFQKEISLYETARKHGIKHLKTYDVLDIIKLFIEKNPSYKAVRMVSDPKKNISLFTSATFITNDLY